MPKPGGPMAGFPEATPRDDAHAEKPPAQRPRPRKAAAGDQEEAMADAREAPRGTPHDDYRALIALCDALVATRTTAEIVGYGYFRGHPVVCLAGETCERYADDLTPTVDEAGASVERPCVQCGRLATPDGPDPCLGMLPHVRAACCGHGVDEPYVLVHGTVRGQQARDYFARAGVGPPEDVAGRRDR